MRTDRSVRRWRLRGTALAGCLAIAGAIGGSACGGGESAAPAAVRSCTALWLPALVAFDAASGDTRWITCSEELAWRTVLGVDETTAFVEATDQDYSDDVVAYRLSDGAELWRVAAGQTTFGWAPGSFAGSGVVVISAPGRSGVIGLDAETGAERWRTEGALAPIANTGSIVVLADASSPLAGPRSGLVGVDRVTGAELWSDPTLRYEDVSNVVVARGAAAVSGETVVLPSHEITLAIDATTGAVLWEGSRLDHPTAAEDRVVGVSGSARVAALDLADGSSAWVQPGSPSYGEIWALGDGAAYVVGERGVLAYELSTGTLRWTAERAPGMPQAAVEDGVAVMWESVIGVLEAEDGSIRWSRVDPVGVPYMDSLAVSDELVVVGVNSLPWGD
jgi:outer membrane protein assembly factor BamB